MKLWYGPNPECPDCEAEIKPEFYTGFWRVPEHNIESGEPCGAYGERIVSR